MKILSWNVNGLRAVVRKNALAFLETAQPDIVCLQETKARPEDVADAMEWASGYHAAWNSAEKKGYSGTLILSRTKPLDVLLGMGMDDHDREGRIVAAEFDTFILVNVYVPNSKRELTRLGYRQEWDRDFLAYLKRLERKKPVVVCGDFNVAHNEIDLARPKQNTRTHGFTIEERTGFSAFVEAGFLDTFREFEPSGGHYTWWSLMAGARARNVGWRIDYFLISRSLRPKLQSAFILPEITGSDHCPTGIVMAP